MSRTVLLSLLLAAASHIEAQNPDALMQEPTVKAAFQAIEHNEPEMLSEQARICEIASPPFHEEQRGLELKRLFEQLQLQNVRIDKAGNVIGVRPGEKARPNVVLAAHLDTVFPEGTNVKVTHEGNVMKGPGSGTTAVGSRSFLA